MKALSGFRACFTVEEPDSVTWPVFSMFGLQKNRVQIKHARTYMLKHTHTEREWTGKYSRE